MKTNRIIPDLSIKKIWNKLTKHDNDISQLSNPSLLINGNFQVNQRGQTEYIQTSTSSAKTYTVDRWLINSDSNKSKLVVNDGSVTFSNLYAESETNKIAILRQYIENELPQGDYTLTVSVKNLSGRCLVYADNGVTTQLSNGLNVVAINSNITRINFQIYPQASIEIEYVKLEQGSIATPFVPRLYAEEILLCQRYCQALELSAVVPFGYGMFTDSLWFRMTFPLTVPMRVTPTFKYTGGYLAATILNRNTQESMFEVSVQCYSGNSVTIAGRISGEAGKYGEFATLVHFDGSNNRKVIFEAEIYS